MLLCLFWRDLSGFTGFSEVCCCFSVFLEYICKCFFRALLRLFCCFDSKGFTNRFSRMFRHFF